MRLPRIVAGLSAPFLALSLAGCNANQALPFVVVLPVAVELAIAEATKDAREIGRWGTWTAAQAGYPGNRTCFLSAGPSSSAQLPTRIGDPAAPATRAGAVQRNRQAVAIVVTYRSSAQVKEDVSFRAGWDLAAGRDATIAVDGRQVAALARRTALEPASAHAKDAASGQAILAALRDGRRAEVVSVGPGNATHADGFELEGFAKARDAARVACGMS